MDLSLVADYFTIAFFFWFGLKKFIPALDNGKLSYLGPIIAFGAAIFTLLST